MNVIIKVLIYIVENLTILLKYISIVSSRKSVFRFLKYVLHIICSSDRNNSWFSRFDVANLLWNSNMIYFCVDI